ncbi:MULTISPECIES: phage major capsid protein [unclassified Leucobacter]|uniref:phage major capsid protein n=1 Tax=unclassified Leucobacter TaxID=2621730 RepID=UPI0006217DD5|nr:phage major capsid protein [Leucobacter sp. Ag1]KKI20556.1 hypothetical protein XM48_07495 [Leucobacter sp. Ag1]
MAGVNTNRTTTGVLLPPQISSEIWSGAQEQSFVMQRGQKTDLPGEGKTIQIITGDGEAKFVGETERKPNVEPTFGSKTMRAYKIALTESFSDEFKRDKVALFNALKPRMQGAVARTFDLAALHGIGAPVGDFDTLKTAPAVSINAAGSVYQGLLGALSAVSTAGGDVTAWGLAPQGEIKVLGEKDGNDRPLFTVNPQQDGSIGALLGREVYKARALYQAAGGAGTVETLGIGGDWSSAYWGAVEGIKYEEYGGPIFNADGSLKHAGRQDNMFSVICEIEIGFIVRDVNRFARLTGKAGA